MRMSVIPAALNRETIALPINPAPCDDVHRAKKEQKKEQPVKDTREGHATEELDSPMKLGLISLVMQPNANFYVNPVVGIPRPNNGQLAQPLSLQSLNLLLTS